MITLAMRCKDRIIWLTTTDRIPDALPPEQENLVAAIWSAILLFGEANANDRFTEE